MEDRVAELRSRWTPESTAAAIAFLEQRPTDFPLPTMTHDGETYLDLRGLHVEQTQIDRAILRNVNLRWATFRDVGLKNARFVSCNLSQASFAECYFRRAQFVKCDLVNSRFDSSDFSGARIEESRIDFATFHNCEIPLQTIRWRDDANPQAMVRICRNLKLNAMSMGNFADAGELTYMEKTYERHAHFRRKAWAQWAGSLLLDWLWGYGEMPWRLAGAMLINVLVFGTLQHWFNAFDGKAWWDHVYFSAITFLTIGYGDLAPVHDISRFLAVLEGATGIGSFGMLIASVTKKIMYR